jgi:hypothetical protein
LCFYRRRKNLNRMIHSILKLDWNGRFVKL